MFLSMTLGIDYRPEYFNPYNIEYLKRFEPVGCRDEATLQTLRSHGISAYLNGCLTAVFPKRRETEEADRVMFIDAPLELGEHIPGELLRDAEFFSQQMYVDRGIESGELGRLIIERYRYYASRARLIVTSRLHATSPAMAAGIPVIFAKTRVDMRFSWIDKYIPLYSLDMYGEIDWNPQPVEYEAQKEAIIRLAVERIRGCWNRYAPLLGVSEFYESRRKRADYPSFVKTLHGNFEKAEAFLRKKYHGESSFCYGIWGVNEGAENFYHYMCRNYKNARLATVVDSFKSLTFHGVESIPPSRLESEAIDNLFILPVSASNAAYSFMRERKIPGDRFCICGEVYLHPCREDGDRRGGS